MKAEKTDAGVIEIGHLPGYEMANRVYDKDGIAPALRTFQGGNLEPKIIEEPQALRLVRTEEGKERRREVGDTMGFKEGKALEPRADGVSNTLSTVEKDNYIAEPFIVASRGRGENNEQHLEVGSSEHTNALTTVAKDNYVAIPIVNATSQGYESANDGDCIDLMYPSSETRRGRVQHEQAQTLTANGALGVLCIDAYNHRDISSRGTVGSLTTATNHGSGNTGTFYVGEPPSFRIRKLTETECFRLMGVKDEDSERVHRNQSKSSMYHLAGDSIVTAVLMAIFGEMFDMDWHSKIKELQENITHESRTV